MVLKAMKSDEEWLTQDPVVCFDRYPVQAKVSATRETSSVKKGQQK